MAALDVDGDELLSAAEVAAGQQSPGDPSPPTAAAATGLVTARFMASDGAPAGDGWLTPVELAAFLFPSYAVTLAHARTFVAALALHRWDADGDGVVTPAEAAPDVALAAVRGGLALGCAAATTIRSHPNLPRWGDRQPGAPMIAVRAWLNATLFAAVDAIFAAADDSPRDDGLTTRELEAHASVFVGDGSPALPWPARPWCGIMG
jgi:hypothetical protein